MSKIDLAPVRFGNFARVAALAVPVALAACASKPIDAPAPAPVAIATPKPVSAPSTPPGAGGSSSASATDLAAYLDPNSPVSQKRSVYFAFDNSTFNAADKSVIDVQGAYLASHANVQVRVEGNTDERGGREYNLALGQRRAQAVETALQVFGVKDGQVEAVSFGEEKPKAAGHDEAAWQQNRRADFVYPSH